MSNDDADRAVDREGGTYDEFNSDNLDDATKGDILKVCAIVLKGK